MIFNELYGAYYNTVARILGAALKKPVTRAQMQRIIEEHAFSESVLTILPALQEGRWPLLDDAGRTPIQHHPTLPLTLLQKRWLRAIALDPRMQLFGVQIPAWEDVEPLFLPEDIHVYDRYGDGDPYEDPAYIRHFRMILEAVTYHKPLRIQMENRHGDIIERRIMPEQLEYSEKDDKFRVVPVNAGRRGAINLARIRACEVCGGKVASQPGYKRQRQLLVLETDRRRNTLERVLLHFAYLEKQAEQLEDGRFRVTLHYEPEDETEILIRILGFGPMVQVVEPARFVELIRERLRKQKDCGLI